VIVVSTAMQQEYYVLTAPHSPGSAHRVVGVRPTLRPRNGRRNISALRHLPAMRPVVLSYGRAKLWLWEGGWFFPSLLAVMRRPLGLMA
jgi:hypothetical protein